MVENNYYNSRSTRWSAFPPRRPARIHFELEPGFRPAKWEQGIKERVEVAAVISTVLRVDSVTQSEPAEKDPGDPRSSFGRRGCENRRRVH